MSISLNDSMGSIVNDGLSFIEKGAKDLKAQMAAIREGKVEDQATAMIEMQFQLGQYNMFVEATSNISKSITDTAKSLAQKVS